MEQRLPSPAALNRAWTLYNDERHANPQHVLKQANADGGTHVCHSQGSCMTHCPVNLSPTGSIAGLKKVACCLSSSWTEMTHFLFVLQRLTAMIMAPLVLVHLGLIVYAVRDGLTAAEILARTQGHWGWIGFYTLFVLCVSVHVPIGLRNIMSEWLALDRKWVDAFSFLVGVLLVWMGLRAVVAVGGLLA